MVIIGGGYTGMWTAWWLKRADPGIDVMILEQDICGGGPSGRNGGFMNGWYDQIDTLVRLYGDEGALRIVRAGADAVAGIADWCEANGVDAWVRRAGYIGVASSPAQDDAWDSTIATAERLGIGDVYRRLSATEMTSICRSPVFRGGFHVAEGGTVQPARLARGMRRVLLEAGVRIHENTPVRGFHPGPPARAETATGMIRAESAVIAVNAWAASWKRFSRWIVPRASYIVITAPAPERIEEIGWTGGEAIYDLRSALRYLRTTGDGRIALGVGSERGTWSSRIGPHFSYSEAGERHATAALHRFFPNFAGVPIEASWGGPIDVSGTHTPFFGTFPSGNVHYGIGYTGNGVGPSHLAGRILAGLCAKAEDENTTLPFVDAEPKRFPPEPLKGVGAALVNEATVRRDDALDAGRKPSKLVDLMARLPRRMGYYLGPD